MATLTKDPTTGAYVVKQGDTLSKIATSQGRSLADLLSANPQFQSNPNLIRPGQIVNSSAPRTFASLNQGAPSPVQTNNFTSNTTVSSPKNMTFTQALIDILKDAQSQNQQGQAKLTSQSNDITGKGLSDAARIFNNPNLVPNTGTGLGMSTQNALDPLNLSISDQQKLATQNLGYIKDIIEQTQGGYDKEQDRNEKAKTLAETIRHNKASEGIDRIKAHGTGVNISNLTSGQLSPLAQAVQDGTIDIKSLSVKARDQVAAELATYKGLQSPRQQTLDYNLSVVNSLLSNPGLSRISGPVDQFLGGVFGDAALAKNQFNQLKGILSVENREKLKGSGAISDFEFKVLSNAATALDRNLSDADFVDQLNLVKDVFEGKYRNTNIGSTNPVPLTGAADDELLSQFGL